MRIQHNIPAMNSYRNYTGNTNKLSTNLEKLSSGYKINRAGDDAAGLAISEKMRAQITGLDVAQKNAKDGISLVQTAEGALTEVHDMLNRMLELADQSANGTYDNTTDRNQLQKEVSQLKTEIDRIADSSNFNGIKLLDGSLEDGGATAIEIGGNAKATLTAGSERSTSMATGFTLAAFGGSLSSGTTVNVNLAADNGQAYSIKLEITDEAIVDLASGTRYGIANSKTGVTDGDFLKAMKGAVRDATGNAFELSNATTIKSTATGAGAAAINGVGGYKITSNKGATSMTPGAVTVNTTKVSASATVKLSGVTAVNRNDSLQDMKSNIFTINEQKFVLVSQEQDLKAVQTKLGDGVTVVWGSTLNDAAGQIAKATGLTVHSTGSGYITFRAGSGEGLRLQIGDTSDSFNKLTLSIKDIHTSALGISGINIGSQGGAATAVDVIKRAINIVSDVRGGLGATQNRLDHTINNLSVMQENIQDAESSIRDTDVADEMMSYTKNNILVQSAQAMLAQANQLPQGVLQLLG